MADIGTIYLLCFEQPYKHARHYLGWTKHITQRLEHHRAGNGSRLMAAVSKAGIEFEVVRTWSGTRDDERRLHRRKNNPRMCPRCQG